VCSHEYVRDFEMKTVGFKCTGRKCTQPKLNSASSSSSSSSSQLICGGRLRDQVLDWEDPLPPKELSAAERYAASSSLGAVRLLSARSPLQATRWRVGSAVSRLSC
jgi:mono-ADP-ribosyltransferase sirtuin 6